MGAALADIPRATRRARIVLEADSAIQTAFPNARDQSPSPEPGFFETAADAATVLGLKADLIGARHQRYAVPVYALIWPDPADGPPTYTLTDTLHDVDGDGLVCRLELDMEAEVTRLELLV